MRNIMDLFENLFITSFPNPFHMQIINLATALPKKEYSTDKLMRIFPCPLPRAVKQNILNLGVSKRYLTNHADPKREFENAEFIGLYTDACQKVIEKSNLSTSDIGFLVTTYDACPFLSPGPSQLLIQEAGLSPYTKNANIQGIASTAFPKALDLAANYLAANQKDYVLLCISGVSSYWFQNQVRGIDSVMEVSAINRIKDKARRQAELRKWIATMEFFLFGDGVAAAVVGRDGVGLSIKRNVEVTNIRKEDYLAGYAALTVVDEPFKFGFYSNLSREIPELGARYTALALRKLLENNAEDITETAKKWVVHTGSEKILNRLTRTHNIAYEKIKESHEVLAEYGNLSGASLPFILEKIVSAGKLSRNDIVLMVGYGWGFSATATLMKYES